MITVYVGESCGPCIALCGALDRARVPYNAVRADTLPAATLAAWRAKGWSTPVVESAAGTFSGFLPAKVQTLIDMRR
ncbi:NrdH-like glutaredoxin [Microbacterium phage A3Wally]|nr:NrdH-like glutaredoxin [Microbacterium phage A3Wally]QWY84180.1 NrdH-like glutaredoxin [Microbacterium phage A3Wally]